MLHALALGIFASLATPVQEGGAPQASQLASAPVAAVSITQGGTAVMFLDGSSVAVLSRSVIVHNGPEGHAAGHIGSVVAFATSIQGPVSPSGAVPLVSAVASTPLPVGGDAYVAQWTNVEGITHRVITERSGSRALRRHLEAIKELKDAFPPRPVPAPEAGG